MQKRKTAGTGETNFTQNDNMKVAVSTEYDPLCRAAKTETSAKVNTKEYDRHQYGGELLPLPMVLVKYLNAMELKVFAFILGKRNDGGGCHCRREAMAKELKTSTVTVSKILNRLEAMGIITQTRVGMRLDRAINFDTIQSLDELLENRLPGAVAAFRVAMENSDVRHPRPYAMALLEEKYTEKYGEEAECYDE